MILYEVKLRKFESSSPMKITILAINIREAAEKAMKYAKKNYMNYVDSIEFFSKITMR